MANPLGPAFYAAPVDQVARALIGVTVLVDGVGGRIVETEAYHPDDPASHSFAGPTARNAPMFGPPGLAYVYRSYGIHWCLNLGCGGGAAVLIRALQPDHGLDAMHARRGPVAPRDLCRGPGRLCQALAITGTLSGQPLDAPPFLLLARPCTPQIAAGPRIGITRGVDTAWRFGLAGSPFLSRPFADPGKARNQWQPNTS
jgi:DNA-3-methyladenine glycosylase